MVSAWLVLCSRLFAKNSSLRTEVQFSSSVVNMPLRAAESCGVAVACTRDISLSVLFRLLVALCVCYVCVRLR